MERFYVLSIQYNKEAQAENRTAPKAFDSYQDAKNAWHEQLAKDGKNPTLGWSICMVIDDHCNVLDRERYDEQKHEQEPEPQTEEE